MYINYNKYSTNYIVSLLLVLFCNVFGNQFENFKLSVN